MPYNFPSLGIESESLVPHVDRNLSCNLSDPPFTRSSPDASNEDDPDDDDNDDCASTLAIDFIVFTVRIPALVLSKTSGPAGAD